MRVLVLYCHPVETSFNAAAHQRVLKGLRAAGHEVDDCDLYAEGFSPVLTREERLGYHDLATNTHPVQGYVDRLMKAEALVIVSPVWNFGWPAMLKGFFDRVYLPGISFKLVDGKVRPNLTHIRKLAVVTSYGGTRWRAMLMRDPPRRNAKGWMRVLIHPLAKMRYLAIYDMNRADDAKRAAHLDRVEAEMRAF